MSEQILLIEDDARLAAMVRDYLGGSGLAVTAAGTGAEGLKLLAGHQFDAVILDLMLPDIDGLEVCRRLRADSSIPVLMLTAKGDPMDRVVGLEIGADDYMAKPFDLRELLARIKSVLRRVSTSPAPRSGKRAATVIRLGVLTLDTESHTLTDEDGKDIPLTSMEYDLLRAFAAAPNRVLNREQLLDAAHRRNTDPFDRSTDVRIARLRRKIEKDPSKPQMIKTIRGAGYKFVPDANS